MNGILTSLLLAELENLLERLLVFLELQTPMPGAVCPAEDSVSLSSRPNLMIGRDTWSL